MLMSSRIINMSVFNLQYPPCILQNLNSSPNSSLQLYSRLQICSSSNWTHTNAKTSVQQISASNPNSSTHPMRTRSKAGVFKPKVFVAAKEKEPNTIVEALSCKEWFSAMVEEYYALQQNKTWSLVPLHARRKAIGCKGVFKIKRNADRTIQRCKARLVAKGASCNVNHNQNNTYYSNIKGLGY